MAVQARWEVVAVQEVDQPVGAEELHPPARAKRFYLGDRHRHPPWNVQRLRGAYWIASPDLSAMYEEPRRGSGAWPSTTQPQCPREARLGREDLATSTQPVLGTDSAYIWQMQTSYHLKTVESTLNHGSDLLAVSGCPLYTHKPGRIPYRTFQCFLVLCAEITINQRKPCAGVLARCLPSLR